MVDVHFSTHFEVDPGVLREYGAFDISVVSDLPMFIDPFLLFNSKKPEYQELHEGILRYLRHLRDKATDDLDPNLISNLYRFKEVRQNWLGFTLLGNGGSGLGKQFADSLHASLGSILQDFGEEKITRSGHLEKLALIRPGVGRDSISDFTTNLIKEFLCDFTARFAADHIDPKYCGEFAVPRVRFNYDTESWETDRYTLPRLDDDFVLLTPVDILTKDDTWISHSDMIQQYNQVAASLPDAELRSQVDQYFRRQLSRKPSAKERRDAAAKTYRQFKELIDYYIKLQEDDGAQAEATSSALVEHTDEVFVQQLQQLVEQLRQLTGFYDTPLTSYDEALARAQHFKHYIENQDGYQLINDGKKGFSAEKDVQLYFGIVWFGSEFDLNREPNNGRGPVDFTVSRGSVDKSLVEFKLASNTQLKRNLQKQVAIYEKANQTRKSIKVIVCYTAQHQRKVQKILKELGIEDEESIIVIDARSDNKPSASRA